MTAAKDDRYRVALMLEAVGRLRQDLLRFGKEDLLDANSDGRKILRSDLIDLVEPAEGLSRGFVRENGRLDVERLRNLRNKQLVREDTELDPEDVSTFLESELDTIERELKRAKYPK